MSWGSTIFPFSFLLMTKGFGMGIMSEMWMKIFFACQLILLILLFFLVGHLGIVVGALYEIRLGGISGIQGPPVFTHHPIDM